MRFDSHCFTELPKEAYNLFHTIPSIRNCLPISRMTKNSIANKETTLIVWHKKRRTWKTKHLDLHVQSSILHEHVIRWKSIECLRCEHSPRWEPIEAQCLHNHHATLQHEHEEEDHEIEGRIRAKSLVQRSEPTHVGGRREEEKEEDGEAEGGGADAGIVTVL